MPASLPPTIAFDRSGPFFTMVSAFLASTVGLGPVFDPSNPLGLGHEKLAVYNGKISPAFAIDMGQVVHLTIAGGLAADAAVDSLTCMLVNSAYELVSRHNDHSPEFEVFRHLRNAASHGNRFSFGSHEPKRPASWRGFSIDHSAKGKRNPLSGSRCFGFHWAPADAILLLSDIEGKLVAP